MSKNKQSSSFAEAFQGTVAIAVAAGIGYTVIHNGGTKAVVNKGLNSLKHDLRDGRTFPSLPKNPTQITTNMHISVKDAEKLFGVVIQENMHADPTALAVQGIQHVAHVLGKNTYGWNQVQDGCLDILWTRESGWRANALNPQSGASNIPQKLGPHPDLDMYEFNDFGENPVTQIDWGEAYIHRTYGTPCHALERWNEHENEPPFYAHWY